MNKFQYCCIVQSWVMVAWKTNGHPVDLYWHIYTLCVLHISHQVWVMNCPFWFSQINSTEDVGDVTNPFRNENIGVEKFLELNSLQDHNEYCLAYIFADRDFNDGVLGLAWVGSTGSMYWKRERLKLKYFFNNVNRYSVIYLNKMSSKVTEFGMSTHKIMTGKLLQIVLFCRSKSMSAVTESWEFKSHPGAFISRVQN